jgi:alkylation response protein AidB-like acyl-CoA dehydrogenase
VQEFLHGELAELARAHDIGQEKAPRASSAAGVEALARWGFYGMTLPEKLGGLGLSVLDHVLSRRRSTPPARPLPRTCWAS